MPLRELLLVRHGESVGNVARELAEGSGAEVIDIDGEEVQEVAVTLRLGRPCGSARGG